MRRIAFGAALILSLAAARAQTTRPTSQTTRPAEVRLWIEAESYAERKGATAPHFAMDTASAGQIVDSDWGGRAGDFLRYRFDLPRVVAKLHVTLRVAREPAGHAELKLVLDGDEGKSATLSAASTGGWGFQAKDWAYVSAVLPVPAAGGKHTLDIRSTRDKNNINLDGFYLSDAPIKPGNSAPGNADTFQPPPLGPSALPPLGGLDVFCALPCKTPLCAPLSKQKAYVTSDGRLQVLNYFPDAVSWDANWRARRLGPSLHVLLDGHGPWKAVSQHTETNGGVVTTYSWTDISVDVHAWALRESEGYYLGIEVRNLAAQAREFRLVSLVRNLSPVDKNKFMSANGKGGPVSVVKAKAVKTKVIEPESETSAVGPVWGLSSCRLEHRLMVQGSDSGVFFMRFLAEGDDSLQEPAGTAWAKWPDMIRPPKFFLGNSNLHWLYESCFPQLLMLIEPHPDGARILKGLEHYYGANPYDTFQAARALDAVGLKDLAAEILRHQIAVFPDSGVFQMWELPPGQKNKAKIDQWIVQGLAPKALWDHYELWQEEAWLKEIAPVLVKAAKATLNARAKHREAEQKKSFKQGLVTAEGMLPPCGGDGGLGFGYHWSQNAGPIAGVRIAAAAAKKLNLPEAAELEAGYKEYQAAFDKLVRDSAAANADGGLPNMIPAFPGASGPQARRPLWGVVMSVSAFDAIPADDPAAMKTLEFLRANKDRGGLHLNLGYSPGIWPYLSAEVALWHAKLGQFDEAWKLLQAIAAHASPTGCWYEEQERSPPRGHGDPCDVWATATYIHLLKKLLLWEAGDDLYVWPALPKEWMKAGKSVSMRDAPTRWGKCSFETKFEGLEGKPPGGAAFKLTLPASRRPKRVIATLAPDDVAWKKIEVSGAKSHSRSGRNIVLVEPGNSVIIEMR